ncbi:MAG: TonB-dependent receptor [Prevotella sp.]|uniref:TonB-dependent receptor n=1 Tax=Prevotella sp. TaxID=59823 RepID=UPI002A314D2A|nr:TonB-dependent receptor [Prevotella sp.]MDD7318995.1 TonB-dependent receptor [Prevotellaceae bacterium]MDY4020775.1 TonB-dependent receptor [Prevotella sp.]
MKSSLRLVALAVLLLIPAMASLAQSIRGSVADEKTKEPIVGAIVEVVGANIRTITDVDGNFVLSGLKERQSYKLVFRSISYKSEEIDGVKATSDNAGTPLDVLMSVEEQSLGEVVVTGVERKNTETANVQALKASPIIVSNISAGEIKRTQDSNAGEVIRRIPGVSLIDDKFVMVRGLSQRYNNVWINGGAVPSSEADSRAFSFDMIPSSQIDNLTIIKVSSPEYPADYTGGFIMINTKEIPVKNEFNISVGGGWNDRSAFSDFYSTKGSGTDWLGFDSGLRSLNNGIKTGLNTLGQNSGGNAMIDLAGNGLNNDWMVSKKTPIGELKVSADLGRSWQINGARLGMIASVNYTNEYRTYTNMINNFYDAYDVVNDRENPLRLSTDNQYNHNVRLGAMLNFTYLSPSGNNKYQLKNIFNQIGNSRYTNREGISAQSEPEKSAEYYYRSRTTYTGQITGKHTFGGDALDWSVGYAYANRRLPDRRKYILYNEDPNKRDEYIWLYQNDISREWTSLDEHIISAQVNDEHQFAFGSWMPKLKVGAYGEYRTRDYYTRNFIYWYNSYGNNMPEGFRSTDMPTLLSNSDNFSADRLYLLEDVNKINDYSGRNTQGAGYISTTLPFGNLTVLAGLRYEWNQMELISNTRQYEESHSSHFYRHGDLFPSLNATYRFNDKVQMRMSYGRNVNRPEFREVSPSVYYDFDLASDVQGNFNLKNCYVDNLDLRFEWYPGRGEVISIAGFYKHFNSPIEWVYTMSGGTDVIYSYKNAKSADNFGVELDIRKSLDFIGLRDFSWSFNGSLIHSRVRFEQGSMEYDRAMQGQSPYLVNTGLFYKNEKLQLDVNLLYNRIGKRIVGVGRTMGGGETDKSVKVPDSYEMPRDALDITAAKRFGSHFEIKLGVRDIFNQNIEFKQFSKLVYPDGTNKEIHQTTRKYKPGRNFSLTATYKF